MNNHNIEVFHFSWSRIRDKSQFIQPIIKKKPEFLILCVGTNDATTNNSRKIVDTIFQLKSAISKSLPDCRVIVSKPTCRSDNGKAALTIRNLNIHLSHLEMECIKNGNINDKHLGKKGLHSNTLTLNFLNQIRKF